VTKVVIWDAEGLPPLSEEATTLLWRGFSDGVTSNVISIPRLIEENADTLRARYLAWVYDLGEMVIQGKRLVDHLKLHPNFSYWWMTLFTEKCNYSKSPQIDDAIRLMAFTDWAADYPVESLVLTSANQPLAECMRLWCEKLGVTFEWQRQPKPVVILSWIRRVYQTLPMPLQALVGLLKYVVDRFPLRGVGLKEWRETEGQATFVSYLFNLVPDATNAGIYKSRYWGHLPDDLQAEGCKTNWLHIYIKDVFAPKADLAAQTLRRFNKTGQGLQIHATLDTFLSLSTIFQALSDWSRLVWKGWRLQHLISSTTSKGLDLWPLFADDWRQSTSGYTALSNSLHLSMLNAAIRLLPKQQVGVYLQENQGWEFGLIYAWKAAGHRRLVGCPHSSVRFWDLRYFFDFRAYNRAGDIPLPMPDQIALNGKAATDAYLTSGYPANDLVQVEALRYLYLKQALDQPVINSSKSGDSVRLLVLGDYLPSNTRLQMYLLEKAAKSLSIGTKITIKPHPACPIRAEDYPGLSMTITMEPIAKLLSECDIAYTSAVTSAAVDAYCASVPVVSVLDPNTLNLSPLRGCAGALFASTPEELSTALMLAVSLPIVPSSQGDFFTTDPQLPRWKKLLLGAI
jgi:surface carbohydrate biosynthesis protein (TIGR04326 family)